MKKLISKLVLASIFSITLFAITHTVPHLSQTYRSYLSSKMTHTQPVHEMPDGSYSNLVNTLFSSTVM